MKAALLRLLDHIASSDVAIRQSGLTQTRHRRITILRSLLVQLLWLGVLAFPVSAQIIQTVAGGGIGDGGPAIAALFYTPKGVAVDSSGNLYIADFRRIRKVTVATGIVTTVAGTGTYGYNGDNIAATTATLEPSGVAVDSSGNLYIAEGANHRIRKVTAATGIITTVAGTGSAGYNGDNVAATSATLNNPSAVTVDTSGNLYIADSFNQRVRKVTAATGIITTLAGTGSTGYNGDNVAATSATLYDPRGVAFDSSGNLYIADSFNGRIRKVTEATGVITTVAGTISSGYNGDNIAATSATLNYPQYVAVDSSDNLHIADTGNGRIRKVTASTGMIATVAGTGASGYNGDSIAATSATLNSPRSIAIDLSGDLYIADSLNYRIRKVTAATGIITTPAGTPLTGYNYSADNIVATSATLANPNGIAVDSSGNLYIAEQSTHRIRKVTASTGIITTVAGTGTMGYNGDNIAATGATLNNPQYVAVDVSGNLYIADSGNNRVRKVTAATGIITTLAGTGSFGYNGDNIAATGAMLSTSGVAVDSSGNLYIADANNYRIRKVDVNTGIITTVAGTGANGYNGDNIAATSATLDIPRLVAVDLSGNLYITSLNRIRKVTVATGIITTVAGTGSPGYNGENISATSANIFFPNGVAIDPSGNLYISVTGHNLIRKVTAATGYITTVAGNQSQGYNGDNIAATSATLYQPKDVALDSTGNLYIADFGNGLIRKVTIAPPAISIVSPSAGTVVTGVVEVSGIAAADGVISSVAVSIDGGAYAIATGTTSWTFNLNTTSLPNGAHTITARVLDAFGNAATASIPITVTAPTGVFSRKSHGLAGAFELPVDPMPTIDGNVTIEPRAIGSGHLIVFRYGEVVTSYGTVAVVDSSNATVAATAIAIDNEVRVSLANVTDRSRVTITLTGITTGSGMFNASTSMGFLEGDVNQSGQVDAFDVSAGKARAGQIAGAGNFSFDLNGSGVIAAAEISAMKARLNRALLP